jgi:deoxyribonucleoside regulator
MPEQPTYTDQQLIMAARLYFLDGLGQAQIGKLVHVSQSKVSRMLALARERGLVRVTVPDYEPRHKELEGQLKGRFGVDAVVIRAAAGLGVRELRQTVGYFAAPVVSKWIRPRQVVAIAGGRTLHALVEHMKPAGAAGGVVAAQAMGNIDSSAGDYDAVELGRHIASAWSGSFLTLNTPAILPDAAVCRQLLELEQVERVFGFLERADLTLVGIGTLENSVFVERRILSPTEIDMLRESGAVGEILGRFFDASGRECDTVFRKRVVSVPLKRLRHLRRVAAVVSGCDRSAAVAAAIRGGLVNRLVIDEGGAAALAGIQQ